MERKITTIGTVQAKRKEISNEIKQVCNRDIGFYKIFWNEPEKNINLNSFIVNSKPQESEIFQSYQQCTQFSKFQKIKKKKPALYKLCDYTKGGTDIADQKLLAIRVKPSLENEPQLHFLICLTFVA